MTRWWLKLASLSQIRSFRLSFKVYKYRIQEFNLFPRKLLNPLVFSEKILKNISISYQAVGRKVRNKSENLVFEIRWFSFCKINNLVFKRNSRKPLGSEIIVKLSESLKFFEGREWWFNEELFEEDSSQWDQRF